MVEAWHDQFNPKRFLARVRIDQLIQRNESYNENQLELIAQPCILCSGQGGPGLLLNDKSYLCKPCFEEVSHITYPEKYEKEHRMYLTELSARNLARSSFIDNCWYLKISKWAAVMGVISLCVMFYRIGFIIAPVAFWLIHYLSKKKHGAELAKWEDMYPDPDAPLLKHFHDPTVELTPRDKMTLKVFNNWPGYPPFWGYLREIVLSRDGSRCQVSGCPSRVELHIHHIKPVSKGGEHVPTNLVSLCTFHHALEPDEGHERTWGAIKNRYFTIVREHVRSNSFLPGYHKVRAHIRRLELIKKDDLASIMHFYRFACPSCGTDDFGITINARKVNVECTFCGNAWHGDRQLSEETGPKLAEILTVTRNPGHWYPRWDMLEARSESTFQLIHAERKQSKKGSRSNRKSIKDLENTESPICPDCGAPMRLIKPRKGLRWKPFYGCSQYKITGCRGSRAC